MKSLMAVLLAVGVLATAHLACPENVDAQFVTKTTVNPPGLFNRTTVTTRSNFANIANVNVNSRALGFGRGVNVQVNGGQTVLLAPQVGFVPTAAFVPTANFATTSFVPTGFGSLAVSNGVLLNNGFVAAGFNPGFVGVRSLGVCSGVRCR